jgi:BirA family transcriptional regulator, biotin operon repressor / biotin---[acetyl-CoA-carboxylase] ligase
VRTLRFDTIDSTNAEAHRLAGRGERGPLWIVSKRQTGGRGRLGRAWISEPGNLYCTHLFSARCDVARASQLGFVASLAVFDLAAELLGESRGIGLKWPNDVLLDGAKFCGILPEVLARPSADETVIGLGIGINLAHAPEGLPYPVTALGNNIAIEVAFAALARVFETWRTRWNDGTNFAAIRDAWQDRAVGIGAAVSAAGESGIFRGLAEDGALILELAAGERRHVHSGEARISHPETSA